jgi:uncharacterized membrane protein YfcA
MKASLYIGLLILGIRFLAVWAMSMRVEAWKQNKPAALDYCIGIVVNFLDTLGIGAFATTTSCFKLWHLVRDEEIPGTLNVGLPIPGILEAFLYIAVIDVAPTTLFATIGAATIGGWLGAGVVAQWSRRRIQIGMGIMLLLTATFSLLALLHFFPAGGDLTGFTGVKLVVAVAVCGVLGALKTLGIGFYAPCMMAVSLLGMNPRSAYPIMIGSIAFVGPVAGVEFIRKKRYNLKSALGLFIGGLPGVFAAAFLVRSLPLQAIRWLIVAVVFYTALMMLRSAAAGRAARNAAAQIAKVE